MYKLSFLFKSKFKKYFDLAIIFIFKVRFQVKNFLTTLWKLIKLFVQNIEELVKKTFWFTSLIIVGLTLYGMINDSTENRIYIETIELPEELVKLGLTSTNASNNLIKNLQKLNEIYNKEDNNFKYSKDRKNDFGLNPCRGFSIEKPIIENITKKINLKISSNFDAPEIIIPETGLSLSILRKFFHNLIGKSTISLKSSIIKTDLNNGYSVQVYARYSSTFWDKSEASATSIEQAQEQLALLILKYTNPVEYAYLIFGNDSEKAVQSILIATNNISEYQDNSLPYTLLGYLYLNSNKLSEKKINSENSINYFDKALKINSLDSLALLGKTFVNRALVTNDPIAINNKEKIDREDIAFANSLIKRNIYSKEAYQVKILIHQQNGEVEKVINDYDNLIKTFPKNEEVIPEYINFLISNNKKELANQILNKELSKYKISRYNYTDFPWPLAFSSMLVQADMGNYSYGNRMASYLQNQCLMRLWDSHLTGLYLNEKDQIKQKS